MLVGTSGHSLMQVLCTRILLTSTFVRRCICRRNNPAHIRRQKESVPTFHISLCLWFTPAAVPEHREPSASPCTNYVTQRDCHDNGLGATARTLLQRLGPSLGANVRGGAGGISSFVMVLAVALGHWRHWGANTHMHTSVSDPLGPGPGPGPCRFAMRDGWRCLSQFKPQSGSRAGRGRRRMPRKGKPPRSKQEPPVEFATTA